MRGSYYRQPASEARAARQTERAQRPERRGALVDAREGRWYTARDDDISRSSCRIRHLSRQLLALRKLIAHAHRPGGSSSVLVAVPRPPLGTAGDSHRRRRIPS